MTTNDSIQVPMTVKKSKCAHPSGTCTDRVAKIVGDCKYCKQSFCSKHRMVEAHACENMESCRQAHFDRNSEKLSFEKVKAVKLAQ